ncbi:MAG: Hsp20/alpha crystallin family protein [Candidatus Omnitrophica bacterium]|nr:Hsp20/alpha crystallin family protein [Candidatus Omnitrophota bacterium]
MKIVARQNQNWWENPFSDLENIQREMNKMFNVSLGRNDQEQALNLSWVPAVDVLESKDDIVVRADLPGISKEDIQISLEDSILTIKGEKKFAHEEKDKNYYKIERSYGAFFRSVPLPISVDANKVDAKYNNGVLEIKLLKREEAKPKQIKINVN